MQLQINILFAWQCMKLDVHLINKVMTNLYRILDNFFYKIPDEFNTIETYSSNFW